MLTAGHCITGKREITVGYNSFQVDQLRHVKAERWVRHPDYSKYNKDLGLIVTRDNIILTDSVKAVFPGRWLINATSFHTDTHRPMLLCGWGKTEQLKLGGLKCIKFRRLDQKCLKIPEDIADHWCLYPGRTKDGKDAYGNPCNGDDGAGVFPGKNYCYL